MSVRTFLLGTLAAATFGTASHAAVLSLPTTATTMTPFTTTAGGVTATYSSATPGAFAIQSTSGLLSFSSALVDQNFFPGDTLTISFSQPVMGALTIPFAITDSGVATDVLSVSVNGGAATSFGASPTALPLGDPEGTATLFSGATGLTSLTLRALDSSGNQLGFAIGSAAVPEPVSLALVGAGLFGFAASRRRRA